MKIIAIDIRLLGRKRTGDETVFFHLTKELLARDKENEYRLMTDVSEPQKLAILQGRLGCVGQKNVQFVPLHGKNRFIWNLITLPWFLVCNRIDIYHTQYILPFFVPARTKVVTHIHDVSFIVFPKLISFADRLFLSLFIPHSLKRSTLIITPSQFTKDEITKYYKTNPEKIAVIPNALGDEFTLDLEEDAHYVKKKYHIPDEYILYVGTLQPRKNIPFLIRSFAALKQRLPEAKLVLVGSRSAHNIDSTLSETIAETGMENEVIFPGYVDQNDLPSLFRGARVFVFPSLYEGFGIPLLEAMSQGVPVAASDIPCLREIGKDGAVYFDPMSLASCEEKLYNLFTDKNLREETIHKGKDRLSFFSWQKSAQFLLEKYNALS